MRISKYRQRAVFTLFLAAAFLASSLPLSAQTIIPVSDITGGSSVFVFKSTPKAATARFVTQAKSKRTKDQQLQGAKKLNRQYVDLAKVAPRRARTAAVDPNTLPPQAKINQMPKEQASKLFAGVGEWYIDREDSDHAEDFFRTGYTLDTTNSVAKNGLSEALALQGNALLVKDQADAAKKKFDEALTFNANNAVAYYGIGEVYAASEDNAQAVTNFEKALQIDSALTDIYVPLGVLYYQNGDIAKADRILTSAMAQSPDDPETQYFLGLVRYAQNDNIHALEAFRGAKKGKPDYAEAWYYTGQTLIRLDNPKDAIVELTKATDLKPNYFEAWFALGTAYFALENYPKAIDAYNQAVKFKNSSPQAQANLGDAYRLSGNFRDAEGRYNLANSLAPNDKNFSENEQADVYNKIGFVIARQCDAYAASNTRCGWQRAVTALEKAVTISHSPVDYANLGWAYYNAAHNDLDENRPAEGRAKLTKARDNLLKAVAGSPSYMDGPMLNLAVTYRDMGDYQGAIDTLKKVVAKQPNWAFAHSELANAYLNNKNYKDAADESRKAIGKDDKFGPAYLNLGKAEFLNGNIGEAKKAHQKLKSLKQDRLANELSSFTKGAVLN
jgi:FimV-like protein